MISLVAIVSALVLPVAAFAQTPESRPNILFLFSDDHRADAMGCAGHPIVQTPNLDALAAGGVHFTNNFCTTAICSISRASVFSGQYARRHGINDFTTGFTPEAWARCYPLLLRDAGYFTGFIGKFGVGTKLPGGDFDYFKGFPGQGSYHQKRGDGTPIHLNEVMGNQAVEFLETAPRDRPFALSISFKAPHVEDSDTETPFPFDPRDAALYEDVEIPPPPVSEARYYDELPTIFETTESRKRWRLRFSTPELFQRNMKGFYRLISGMDREIGRIRAKLDELGLSSNTLIIFSSDNGYLVGERGMEGKWLMYEESIRTPLIIHDPRPAADATRGSKVDWFTLNIDLAPTMLAAAGVAAPEVMQGRSLLPFVSGPPPKTWRDRFFYEHNYTHNGGLLAVEGVRAKGWTYTLYLGGLPQYEQLFDLEADPHQVDNLAEDEAHQERLRDFRNQYTKFRQALR